MLPSLPFPYYIVAVIGLAVLMVVHEAGHYFVARKFGMTRHEVQHRLRTYSFGGTRPKGSPTVFQSRDHPVPCLRADRGDEPLRGE